MKNLNIDYEWQRFRRMTIKASAPDDVVAKAHDAFYAGAGAVFQALLPIIMSQRQEGYSDTDKGRIDDLCAELAEFGLSKAAEFIPRRGSMH